MPKNEWYSSELWQLQAPWLEENIANTEGQGITLGARYKIKITEEEAKSLNFLKNNPDAKSFNAYEGVSGWQSPEPLQKEKEVEISFKGKSCKLPEVQQSLFLIIERFSR